MARVFENKDGNWDKVSKIEKDVAPYVDVIQELAKRLAKATLELENLLLEGYKAAPKVDCLFYDSPISPGNQVHYLKSYLRKLNWRGIQDIPQNPYEIKEFKEQMNLAMKWLTKYKQ